MARSGADSLRSLASHFPPERFLQSAAHRALYAADSRRELVQIPAAVAIPNSAEEVVLLLQFCQQQGIPFVPRGHGTGRSGAACPPGPDALVIVLNQMDQILAIDPQQATATVQPGVTLDELDRETRLHGFRLGPTPPHAIAGTLGGLLALNSTGWNPHFQGPLSAQLLASTLILPGGEVAELGFADGRLQLGSAPLALVPGNEGRLGILVEMTLALTPVPEQEICQLARFPTMEKALEAADALLFSGLLPARLELLDQLSSAFLLESRNETRADGSALLRIGLEGSQEDMEAQKHRSHSLLKSSGADSLETLDDPEQLVHLRQQEAGILFSRSDILVEEATVPRSRLPQVWRQLQSLERDLGQSIPVIMDARSGSCYASFPFVAGQAESLRQAEQAALQFLLSCAESGGTLCAGKGIGRSKASILDTVLPQAELKLEREIRSLFDPATVSNPYSHPDGELTLFPSTS